jgi:hypothetical protein
MKQFSAGFTIFKIDNGNGCGRYFSESVYGTPQNGSEYTPVHFPTQEKKERSYFS